MKRAFWNALVLPLVCALSACSGGGGSALAPIPVIGRVASDAGVDALSRSGFIETWSQFAPTIPWIDGSIDGRWKDQWNGYGSIDVVRDPMLGQTLLLAPQAQGAAFHSALVTSRASYGNFAADASVTTKLQTSTSPYPWEVGWVLFHYADPTHFYAFTPQPNGWELSKEDPAYPGAQRFLATGSSPAFPIGGTYDVHIEQWNNIIRVSVNGTPIVAFTDNERPYVWGAIGLYTEEATVAFGLVAVTPSQQ